MTQIDLKINKALADHLEANSIELPSYVVVVEDLPEKEAEDASKETN